MLRLGAALTITARNCYQFEANPGDLRGLMGINEIQHRLFARIRDLRAGHEWTIESFVGMILDTASNYGVPGEVGWAVKQAMPSLKTTSIPN
jgi:hypothetical protein